MAAPMIRFKHEGYRELRDRFIALDRKMRRTIATKAVRAGNAVMTAAIRSHVPVDSGAAKRAIGGKIKTYRNSNVTVGIVGERFESRRGKEKEKKARWGGPHLHLIEYGTAERFWTGEKRARQAAAVYTARFHLGKRDSGAFLRAQLAAAGSFGRQEAVGWNFRRDASKQSLVFSRNIRAAMGYSGMRSMLSRKRHRDILADVRSGRSTGRVVARPFFEKAFRRAVRYVQEAQTQVLREEINRAWRAA